MVHGWPKRKRRSETLFTLLILIQCIFMNKKKNIFPKKKIKKNTKIPTNGDIIAPILEKVEQIPIPTFLQKKYRVRFFI